MNKEAENMNMIDLLYLYFDEFCRVTTKFVLIPQNSPITKFAGYHNMGHQVAILHRT